MICSAAAQDNWTTCQMSKVDMALIKKHLLMPRIVISHAEICLELNMIKEKFKTTLYLLICCRVCWNV